MGFAAAGLLLTGISTGLSVYGQMQQGETAQKVAEYNAANLETEAANQEATFAEQVKRERMNMARETASLRVKLNASGTQAASGDNLNILGDIASNQQLSIADAARASAMQTSSLRQKAGMTLWDGRMAASSSRLSAFGTLLQGGASMASSFSTQKYQGVF